MTRAAIYARFSTTLQSDRSIDDQVTLCKAFAIQNGYEIVEVYSDAAKSGASMHNRDGVRSLMADAMMGHFEVVIVEALDRLSRDMEDLAGISKRLKFAGIDLVGVHDGVASTVTVGLRGLVGQLFREDNVLKVRRGMSGRVKQGLSGGGQAYGYRPDPANKGRQLIVEDEANVVRRIFEEYAAGSSPRSIAHGLNRDGITPPRGNNWNASTLNGSAQRGNGILHNSLYVGERIWNRTTMVKDPDTGRRVSRSNPESEWERAQVPELRIVSDELWEIAQKQRRSPPGTPANYHKRPKRLLSGLLKCGSCGSGLAAMGKDKSGRVRIRCSASRESDTCPNPRTFYLDRIERSVVSVVQQFLRKPERLALFIKTYQEEQARLVNERRSQRGVYERELDRVVAKIDKIVMQIADDIIDPEDARAAMQKLRPRRKELQELLADTPELPPVITVHPVAAQLFEEKVTDLQKEMEAGEIDPLSLGAQLLRELLVKVVVYKDDKTGRVEVTIHGHLNMLLHQESQKPGKGGVPAQKVAGVGSGGSGGGIRTPDTRIMIPLL